MSCKKEIELGVCERCGYEWVPRSRGKRCPLCGSKHVTYSWVRVDA